jgi:hypothetical protein
MYTAKVRIAPIGGAGSDSRAVVCSPFQNPHLDARLPNSFSALSSLEYNRVVASLLGWRLRESVNAATETTNHHWSAVSPFEDPLKMEIQ